jgi:hypothetical protein
MRPAFSSTGQAAVFGLVTAAFLLLPLAAAKTGCFDRHDVYPTLGWNNGAFSWIQRQIFEETNDVDIAFVGSSLILNDINARYVADQLGQKLHRKAEVFTLGWGWQGMDATCAVARDLLEHRRVRMLVVYDERDVVDYPHPRASHWFLWGRQADALEGVSDRDKMALYGSAVLGAPRHLLSLLRADEMEGPAIWSQWSFQHHAEDFVESRGSWRVLLSYRNSTNFIPFAPPALATPADTLVYSPATRASFAFDGRVPQPYEAHFAREIPRLCAARQTSFVVLHLPILKERGESKICVREPSAEFLGAGARIVGISSSNLWAGVPAADVGKFYYDDVHFNKNGEDRITPLITPALLNLYDEASRGR